MNNISIEMPLLKKYISSLNEVNINIIFYNSGTEMVELDQKMSTGDACGHKVSLESFFGGEMHGNRFWHHKGYGGQIWTAGDEREILFVSF